MICPNCGSQLDPETSVCPICLKEAEQKLSSPKTCSSQSSTYHLPSKNPFSFYGRAKRKEFWSYLIGYVVLFNILLVLLSVAISHAEDESTAAVFEGAFVVIVLILLIPLLAVSVRRLHDLGMSGFWLMYLNVLGLPVIYLVYLLDLDSSCNRVIEKIWNSKHPWLSWIVTILFWWVGAPLSLFLLFMYEGKHEDNEFGPNPY
ncbi:MAG: DUF805 domain-containing protein [Lentisphaeria bacterium]|nr:DUF805 domain-containing protein [Lentisphaeria bacterium]